MIKWVGGRRTKSVSKNCEASTIVTIEQVVQRQILRLLVQLVQDERPLESFGYPSTIVLLVRSLRADLDDRPSLGKCGERSAQRCETCDHCWI